ncbi:ribonuclease III [Breznakiella homolactica]|uniref:Ribonuclease 3 n=1 Tax=Breznakiella homolactica TaxID=2798577 RepID=A0A7T7XKL9_9SPIR|nr:ribonuclease III [Breznakiella homolactica]QQO08144.1 ribonuclease III [Breznakiella homolactica]
MADRFQNAVCELPALSPGRKKELAAFQKTAAIRFKSPELLNLSFMHRSVSNETNLKINNERLEFLGDAILGAVTATLLYERLRDRAEGDLAKIKSVVVSEDVLSGVALQLQIDSCLILGKGEELSGGRTKKAILADAMEALIGAYYLDSGYKAVFSFVSRCIAPEIERVLNKKHHQDYKTLLQELSQRLFKAYPQYHLVKRTGPEHERLFWMEVTLNSRTYGPGTGKNKKSAEQEAAKIAYEELNGE